MVKEFFGSIKTRKSFYHLSNYKYLKNVRHEVIRPLTACDINVWQRYLLLPQTQKR
jgi:hypothetical protein